MCVLYYENSQLYLRLVLNVKWIHHLLKFNQSQWLNLYVEFNAQIRREIEKNGDKDGKELYKLIENAVYSKTM